MTSSNFNPNKKKHYVYKIVDNETSVYYIGVRSCSGRIDPMDDLGVSYFTSGKIEHLFRSNPSRFTKIIIDLFPTRKIAEVYEANLIYDNKCYPLNENYAYNNKLIHGNHESKSVSNGFMEFLDEQNYSPSKRKRLIEQEKKRIKNYRAIKVNKNKPVKVKMLPYMGPKY